MSSLSPLTTTMITTTMSSLLPDTTGFSLASIFANSLSTPNSISSQTPTPPPPPLHSAIMQQRNNEVITEEIDQDTLIDSSILIEDNNVNINNNNSNSQTNVYANQVFNSLIANANLANSRNATTTNNEVSIIDTIERRNTINEVLILDTDDEGEENVANENVNNEEEEEEEDEEFGLPAKMARLEKETCAKSNLNQSNGDEEVCCF